MRKIPLYFPFLLALIATLFCNVLFPSLHLSFFVPFLALTYYAASLSKALWISLGCGLILDLLSSEFRFGLVILLVACSNVISFLVILVNDKKQEIGILQALGATRKSIAFIFGGLGAALGVISSLVGVGAAMLTLKNLDKLVQFLSFLQGHDAFNAVFYGSSLPHELSFQALLFVLIITPLLSLLAGLIPAWKACRLSPSAILRSE